MGSLSHFSKLFWSVFVLAAVASDVSIGVLLTYMADIVHSKSYLAHDGGCCGNTAYSEHGQLVGVSPNLQDARSENQHQRPWKPLQLLFSELQPS